MQRPLLTLDIKRESEDEYLVMCRISAPKWSSFEQQPRVKLKLVLILDMEVISSKTKQSILAAIQDLKEIDTVSVAVPSHTLFPPSSSLQQIEEYLDRATPPNEDSTQGLLKLAASLDENEFYSMLLLTDRHSNFELSTLQELSKVISTKNCTISTFGFGDHNPNLLCQLADIGNGMYNFIEKPDSLKSRLLPTNLIVILEALRNCVGELLSISLLHLKLVIKTHDATLLQIMTPYHGLTAPNLAQINFGPLALDEKRDVICRVRGNVNSKVQFDIEYLLHPQKQWNSTFAFFDNLDVASTQKIDGSYERIIAAEALQVSAFLAEQGHFEAAKLKLQAAINNCTNFNFKFEMQYLLSDLEECKFSASGNKRIKSFVMAHQKQRAAYPNTNYVTAKPTPLIRVSSNEKTSDDGSVRVFSAENELKLTIGINDDTFFVRSGNGESLNPIINKVVFRANTNSAVTLENEPFEMKYDGRQVPVRIFFNDKFRMAHKDFVFAIPGSVAVYNIVLPIL